MELTFKQLRDANMLRLPQFKNRNGEPAHEKPDGSDWKLSAWSNAITGEIGETVDALAGLIAAQGRSSNLIKKIERGDCTLEQARQDLADELADVQTYLDILAMRSEIDLAQAVINKFNRVSQRIGCDVTLDVNAA